MGVKIRRCSRCGQRSRIGKTKGQCKSCRKKNTTPKQVDNIPGSVYRERDKALLLLKFSSYHEYLNSELWKSVRQLVLVTHGKNCVTCGKPYKQIHHKKYGVKELLGEDLTNLVPLCGRCHKKTHFS